MLRRSETTRTHSDAVRLVWGSLASLTVIAWTMLCAFLALAATLVTRRTTAVEILAPIWGRFILWLSAVSVDVEGLEHIDPRRSYVMISNHQSNFDIWVTLAVLPVNLRFVAKQELKRFPFLGPVLERSDHIVIDRQHPELAIAKLNERMARLDSQPFCLLFYAEGTRSPDGRIHAFKKGAVNIAIRTGLPVLPLSISGTWKLLPKGSPIIRPVGRVKLVIAEAIETRDLALDQRDELNERVRRIICDHFDPDYGAV